jgi:hypothetical protein
MNFWLEPGTARHDRRGRFSTLTCVDLLERHDGVSLRTPSADAGTPVQDARGGVRTLSSMTRSSSATVRGAAAVSLLR